MSQVQQSEPVVDESLAPLTGDEQKRVQGRTPWQLFWGRFRKDWIALVALAWVIILIVSAVLAPLFVRFVSHNGPNDIRPELSNEFNIPVIGPSAQFWGGVDALGRDVFVRTLYGARTSIAGRAARDRDLGRDRSGARLARRLLRRQDRHVHVAPDRHLPVAAGVPAGDRHLGELQREHQRLPRRLAEAGRAARHPHHRAVRLDLHREDRPRADAVAARTGVRRGGPGDRVRPHRTSCSGRSCPTSSRR